jgi:invasion protein IalB
MKISATMAMTMMAGRAMTLLPGCVHPLVSAIAPATPVRRGTASLKTTTHHWTIGCRKKARSGR